jgi:tyrosyl-tRNA synthetase
MFGKLMSISDALMWRYYLLLTDVGEAEIARRRAAVDQGRLHPKAAKIELATRIVGDFHSAAAATRAADAFESQFSRGELLADDLPEVRLALADGAISLARLVAAAGLATSTSEASRKIQQGGVRVNRERVVEARAAIEPAADGLTLEVGRRGVRIVWT